MKRWKRNSKIKRILVFLLMTLLLISNIPAPGIIAAESEDGEVVAEEILTEDKLEGMSIPIEEISEEENVPEEKSFEEIPQEEEIPEEEESPEEETLQVEEILEEELLVEESSQEEPSQNSRVTGGTYEKKATPLTTIETLDNANAGITMDMIDYDISGAGMQFAPSNPQTMITQEMVGRVLGEDGFPINQANNGSLAKLFDVSSSDNVNIARRQRVNHLFSKAVYDETGYYEYSSFENYAYLKADGNFMVYDALGTPSDGKNFFFQRGNFMPYNQIKAGKYSQNRNLYDENGYALSEDDPAYNRRLYRTQGDNNYYFGMYLSTNFIQPKSGQVQHPVTRVNEDMIYEFNGDDDLWVYVDGVLLLDIGGTHDAYSGSINFATGDIVVHGYGSQSGVLNTTVREQFYQAGIFPDGTTWDEAKVQDYFNNNTLKNYSLHTLKMFYMERGAYASNLHMKFNIQTIPDGQIQVSKELSNTNKEDYANVNFAFQLYLQEIDSVDERGNQIFASSYGAFDGEEGVSAKIAGENIIFLDGVSVGDATYDNVFYLKPGQTAVFEGLQMDRNYYVKEIGVNSKEYDKVEINETVIKDYDEDKTETGTIEDVVSTEEEVQDRPLVRFINNCSIYNSRELRITKALEQKIETEDTFSFVVQVENQQGQLEAYEGAYYLIDNQDNYWYYDENGVLQNNGAGTDRAIVCKTVTDGVLTGVKVGYTAVIVGILSGTDFRVREVDLDTEKYGEYTQTVMVQDTPTTIDTQGEQADGTIQLGYHAQVTITNRIIVPWKMVKRRVGTHGDADGLLEGAHFILTGSNRLIYYGISQEEGIVGWYQEEDYQTMVNLGKLPDGTYTIQETQAPEGYYKKEGAWTLTLENGIPAIADVQRVQEENGEYTLYLENTRLYQLPETGGTGIEWYKVSGILLLFLGAMLTIYKKMGNTQKKEREYE